MLVSESPTLYCVDQSTQNAISINVLQEKYISYFFGVMKNDQIFPSKVCHFQYVRDSLLVEKLETLEVVRR